MHLELHTAPVQHIDADALLLPVDGQGCRLGSGAASGLRAALPDEDRMDELRWVESELAKLRPIPDGQARVIPGTADWGWFVVSAAYGHNVNDHLWTAAESAALLGRGVRAATQLAASHGEIDSMSLTVIGTSYRLTRPAAIRTIAEALAASSATDLTVCWSLPTPGDLEFALAECERLGVRHAAR